MLHARAWAAHTVVHQPLLTAMAPRGVGAAWSTAWARGFRASTPADELRNVAVIAHVDHGKTSLVDCMLQCSSDAGGADLVERAMDSMDQERERGITIASKVTGVPFGDDLFNIVDTPGHADFGGEVERIMHLVDGVLLVVDAREGVMAQTAFVLEKALAKGLPAVVVLNKVDRPDSRLADVENDVFDLFVRLGATDEQLEYPTIYASAKENWATLDADNPNRPPDIRVLLDTIRDHLPPPTMPPDAASKPFTMLVTQTSMDPYIGKIALGRVVAGSVQVGDMVSSLSRTGDAGETSRVTKLLARRGLQQVPVQQAVAGDIVEVAGLATPIPTDTLCAPGVEVPVECDSIDPPTLSLCIGVNDSPLAGRDGKQLTSALIAERLEREAVANVSIQVAPAPGDEGMPEAMEVRARGELQCAVLLETMRREGFEVSVSPPRVVLKWTPAGDLLEPYEEVMVEVDDEYAGLVIEQLSGDRRGSLLEYTSGDSGKSRLTFVLATRALLGFQSVLKTSSRGTGLMTRRFRGFGPFQADASRGKRGALIASTPGVSTAYALAGLEPRGVLYSTPGQEVYTGMIVGIHSRDTDLDVNTVKGKKLTNVRASGTDDSIRLTPPKQLALEEALTELRPDELLEVTPSTFRLRKRHLDPTKRKRAGKAVQAEAAGVIVPWEDGDTLLEE